MQVRFDVPKNLKDGDILIYENGKFKAVNFNQLIKPLLNDINGLKAEIDAFKSYIDAQERKNKRIAERWKGVK